MHTTALWKSETENDPSWIFWVKAQRTQLLPFAQILTIIIREWGEGGGGLLTCASKKAIQCGNYFSFGDTPSISTPI